MDNLLFYVFLAAIGGLIWLHLNRHNTDKLNTIRAKSKNFTWVKVVEVALLLCAGAMGSFFAYQLLSPISVILAVLAAVLVIFFNMAEGVILRSTVNSFRHNNILVGGIGVITVLMLMLYSITAGSSVIETFLNKHDDIKKYYQYEELASKQKIENAKAQVLEAQMKARDLDRYDYLNNPDVAKAQANAALLSSQEYSRMAALMRDKAPDLKIAFGFDHESIAFIMALVLELSIIGVVIYQVLYIHNDALLASIRFENKSLSWNVSPHHTANLNLEQSPAPEVVALPDYRPQTRFAGTVPNTQTRVETVPSPSVSQPSPAALEVYADSTDTVPIRSEGDSALAPKERQETAFNEWLAKVKTAQIEPTVRPAKDIINQYSLAKGMPLREALAHEWLDRAFNLGVLELRQPQKAGLSKYVLKKLPTDTVLSLRKGEGV